LIAALFASCIVLLALGVPVAFALGGSTLIAILVNGGLPLVALPKYLFSGIDVFALMAVPFFILTAELMTGGALSEVLLRFASQFVGRFRGGLGHTNILAITFFSGISGSALADAAGPGAIMIRMMRATAIAPDTRGADGGRVDSRPDHPAVDQHDHLRARVSE
jgi:TRAP-type mannitol/chloroaromatic compound transport system permease large subunit